jgi:cytochrome b
LPTTRRLVWDLPVRVAHWALVACVAGSWLTHYAGVEWFAWHRRCVRGPRATLDYLRGRVRAEPVGHNPLGALSVLALLAALLTQAVTGLFANDEIMNAGPFYGWVAPDLSNRVTSLHRSSSDWLLALLALHLTAVGWYVLVRRRPLVRAMLTGRKDASDVGAGDAIDGSRTARAVLIVLLLSGALALAVRAAPEATIALF